MSCSTSASPKASASVRTIRSAAGMSSPLPTRFVAARIAGAPSRKAVIISTRVSVAVHLHAVTAVALAVLGRVGHVAAQLLHRDAIGRFEAFGQLRDVAAGAADDEDARLALEMIADQRVGMRELLGRRLAPDAFELVDLRRNDVEGHLLHRNDVVHRADTGEERAHLAGRRAREDHRAIEIFEQPQMLALVEGVHVVDDQQRAAVDHVPQCSLDSSIAEPQTTRIEPSAMPRVGFAALGRGTSRRELAHAQRRAGEPVLEVRDVLADEIARRRDQADVAARL